jgi:hypothetical protein
MLDMFDTRSVVAVVGQAETMFGICELSFMKLKEQRPASPAWAFGDDGKGANTLCAYLAARYKYSAGT